MSKRRLVSARMFMALGAMLLSASFAQKSAGSEVDYTQLADIVFNRSWKLAPGEHVVVFADPAFDRGMAEPLRQASALRQVCSSVMRASIPAHRC